MDRDFEGQCEIIAFNQQIVNVLPCMNAFCSEHPGLRVEYVSVDPQQDSVFKCVNCISEENVPQSTLIPINLILASDTKTIFANFPITDRSLAIELRTLAQAPTTSEQVIIKISSFFKEFRANLLHKIEIIEQNIVDKAKSISDFGSVIEEYNAICSKQELKAIIKDTEKELSVKSAEIKAICQEALRKEQEHNSSIRISLERLKTLQSAIDFKRPILIQKQIFNQIDRIDMFLVENFKQFQELVERKPNDKNQNISNLMKLVNNKLNGISVESSEHLKEQLNKISFAFQTFEVPEVGEVGTHLESLNENSSTVIQKLVEDLAKNQNANELDDERGAKENLVAGDLVQLMSNKTNFCSNEYIEDVARVMNTLEEALGLFLVRKPRIKAEEQKAFNNLNEKQLFNLTELAMKTNRITEQHSDSYLNSMTPLSQTQPNSAIIREIIKRTQGLRLFSNGNSNLIESLDRILVNYPIFELLPLISDKVRMIPIPISFTKTNYANSSEIQITKNSGQVQFSLDPSKKGQVVSEILDNSLGYLLKLKFTRPIAVANNGGFYIGLIPNPSIHSTNVLSNSHESGLYMYPNYGAKIILKGGKLTSSEMSKTTDCVEFHFCISKQLFFYADQSYSNINQAEAKHFNPSQLYRFGISFDNGNCRPSDLLVTVSEFGTIDPEEVKNFQ